MENFDTSLEMQASGNEITMPGIGNSNTPSSTSSKLWRQSEMPVTNAGTSSNHSVSSKDKSSSSDELKKQIARESSRKTRSDKARYMEALEKRNEQLEEHIKMLQDRINELWNLVQPTTHRDLQQPTSSHPGPHYSGSTNRL